MKKHNPSIPIMLREAQGTAPKVYARYEFGQEKSQSLEGMAISPVPRTQDLRAGGGQAHGVRMGKMG